MYRYVDWSVAKEICTRLRVREIACYRLEDVGVASDGVVEPRSIDQGDSPPIEEKCGRFYVDGAAFKRITNSEF